MGRDADSSLGEVRAVSIRNLTWLCRLETLLPVYPGLQSLLAQVAPSTESRQMLLLRVGFPLFRCSNLDPQHSIIGRRCSAVHSLIGLPRPATPPWIPAMGGF